MATSAFLLTISPWAPPALMAAMAAWAGAGRRAGWRVWAGVSLCALACAALAAWAGPGRPGPGLLTTPLGLALALVVQGLGTVIAAFSARYLQGEPGQHRFLRALSAGLAAVHLLLLADHWLLLIAAWAGAGWALESLLCFYPDRPFARLAARKKRLADRAADLLLLLAAGLAWHEVGSARLSDLGPHLAQAGMSWPLQGAAVAVALAVVLRSALMPVHGWLIQVMEAPTPVSALLHAGIVNLGGFVLIRLAPLLSEAPGARALLVGMGLASAVLAGLVMLTRVSIKVRLAWSTVAQMGFLLLECGLGLYSLAALHLLGHSLYKAHAFLASSDAVRQARRQALQAPAAPARASLLLAPALAAAAVVLPGLLHPQAVPLWWSAVLALAWAPLLWWPAGARPGAAAARLGAGLLMLAALSLAARLAHAVPFALIDRPDPWGGAAAVAGLALLYAGLALLQGWPQRLQRLRAWAYAGFYLDEAVTRLALRAGSRPWVPVPPSGVRRPLPTALTPNTL